MNKPAVELRSSASLADVELIDGRVPNRIMLMPIGKLDAADGRKWEVVDKAHAQEIVDATKARLGRRKFMIDYDHQAVLATTDKVGGRALASGWVSDFEVDDDGIHGLVEWTPQARTALRDREYRYLSPVFGHRPNGRVTRLLNAALTNTPALDMPALAAAQHGEPDTMNKIIEALGLDGGADEDAIVAAIAELKTSTALASVQPIATALGLDEGADLEQVATAAAAAAARPADLTAIAAALGAPETASVEELASAASTLSARVDAEPDPTKYAPIEVVQAANAKLAAISEENGKAVVDAAIAAGKVPPANRQWALSSYRADPEAFATAMAIQPAVLKPGSEDTGGTPTAPALTDDDRALCQSMGWDEATFAAGKAAEAGAE